MQSSQPTPAPERRKTGPRQARPTRRGGYMIGGAAILLGAIGVVHFSRTGLGNHEGTSHLPVVAVAAVARQDLAQTLTISGEFRPYQQVALHSKVAGYLQSIAVDVGDHVKEGQTIAQLDVPELKDELEKATASVQVSEQEVIRAEAIYEETHVSYTRLQDVAKQQPKLVAAQDLDTARAKDAGAAGALAAAKQRVAEAVAQLNKDKATLAYTTITAPFDGVITKRFVDPGALVQAGTSSNSQLPVVDIEEEKRLRLVFPVPESAVALINVGAPVRVTVTSIGTTFEGKISRFSGKVDRATRTMSTEVDVDNSNSKVKPGMYARVELSLRESKGAVAVPVVALSVGDKPSVMVVGADGTLQERSIRLDLQTPFLAEVVSGLNPGELVVVGNRSSLQSGERVSPKVTELARSE